MIIRLLTASDAPQVARIHRQAINTGFLSSLQPSFLESLYRVIPQSKNAFCYVGKNEGKICGFICVTKDTQKLFREIIVRWGLILSFSLLRYLFDFTIMRKIVNNLFYAKKGPQNLPKAEIISVAVAVDFQRVGLGKELMALAIKELQRQRIFQVKALTDEANAGSNSYYLKNGFFLAQRVSHHDHYLNVYVKDIIN